MIAAEVLALAGLAVVLLGLAPQPVAAGPPAARRLEAAWTSIGPRWTRRRE